jgi:hypothetical protein
MNRTDFRTFCNTHNLSTEDAGRDWYDAGVNGAYICTVIHDSEDFAAVKPLLENNEAYLASAERKHGHAWFKHRGYGKIYADDANGVAREIADQYVRFLESQDDISYYSADDIARRDQALIDNPALNNESEDAHFERVAEMQDDGWLAPRYVNEPGHWSYNSGSLILSDTATTTGLWSYGYDNWEQRVILILHETEKVENE